MQTTTPPATTGTKPQPVEADKPPLQKLAPGGALRDEAVAHLQNRNWKDAIRVSLAAQKLRPEDTELHAVVAVAAAYSRKHGLCEAAVETLRQMSESPRRTDVERADSLAAIASARLAQGRFSEADTEARKALAFDSQHEGAWWQLTAAFVGLGWFEQAAECLPLARSSSTVSMTTSIDTPYDVEDPGQDSPDQDKAAPTLAEWQVGKAINTWALSKVPTWIVAVVGVVLFGLLGLALAATAPFFARELRVMRLDAEWRSLAEKAWRTEHRLRISHALLTLAMVAAWVLTLSVAS